MSAARHDPLDRHVERHGTGRGKNDLFRFGLKKAGGRFPRTVEPFRSLHCQSVPAVTGVSALQKRFRNRPDHPLRLGVRGRRLIKINHTRLLSVIRVASKHLDPRRFQYRRFFLPISPY